MKRAFVIGNGPSLRDTPLHLLKDEITYATGRINLIYPLTDWRPTYYVMAERLGWINEFQARHDFMQIIDKFGTYSYIHAGLMGLLNAPQNYELFTTCQHATSAHPPQTWHLPELCHYGSSLHVALQIAAQEDYEAIYLLGCDLGDRHFVEEYGDSLVQAELWTRAHEIAKRSCPIPIYNATIGGELEVYERIDLCQLLWSKNKSS